MAKGKIKIVGITEQWRPSAHHDAFRVGYFKAGEFLFLSAKVHPILKEANHYLKSQKLRQEAAMHDPVFLNIRWRLHENLKDEHGLKEYRLREKVDLKTKAFNFEQSLEEFVSVKTEYSTTGHEQRRVLVRFWLPFFFSQGCEHPAEFIRYLVNARRHLRSVKGEKSGELYTRETKISLCSALNEYMRFLLEDGYITEKDTFTLLVPKLHKKQRGNSTQRNKRPSYTFAELYDMKTKIDETYPDGSVWKLRAYAIFFGVCTGLRKGNVLGMRGKHLHPGAEPPHFETGDNVICGSARGFVGALFLPLQTKTFEGSVKIPLIQPDRDTAVQVVQYLKQHVLPNDYILKCYPTTMGKWWKSIAKDCKFRWVNPHNFKHGYATRGAAKLHEMYFGNRHFLQWCCLHSSYSTTERYIDEAGGALLDAFRRPPSS
jgi:integrase